MFRVEVTEPSQVAEARQRAGHAAAESGFAEVRSGQVALAASELATNLVKHGNGGQILVNALDHRVQLLALDRGPGMTDLEACLADGYSTSGTLGHGLGAVRRLAQTFSAVSWPGMGTAIYAAIDRDKSIAPDRGEGPAGLVIPRPGETAAGDAWFAHEDDAGVTLFVVDGLGHGTEAAVAANAAVAQFQASRHEPPVAILEAVHRAMRHTRGGAVAVARLHRDSATVTFAGLGNIAGIVVGERGGERRMVSHNGTAGHNARKIQAFEYPCPDGIVIMHSDGLSSSWNLGSYPALVDSHPMLVAGVLYRDFGRGTDDATVVVTRTRFR